jgi:hypothetical protein
MCDFFFILACFESLCHCCVRKQACHAAGFLKCLHRTTPFDGSDSLKCLPNRSRSLKCLLYSFVPYFLMVLFAVKLCKIVPHGITGSVVDACSLVHSMLLVLV